MVSIARTRSVSSGVRLVVGSVVTSLTEKIPNCTVLSSLLGSRCRLRTRRAESMRLHVLALSTAVLPRLFPAHARAAAGRAAREFPHNRTLLGLSELRAEIPVTTLCG
jgi:hypothetical protein